MLPGNVFDATKLFEQKQREALLNETFDTLARYIGVFKTTVGAAITAEIVSEMRNIISTIPNADAERICSKLVFTNFYYHSGAVAPEDAPLSAVYVVTNLVFDLGAALGLDETEEGDDLSHILVTIIEIESVADPSSTLSIDGLVPWDDDGLIMVNSVPEDIDEMSVDLTLPELDKDRENKVSFSAVFAIIVKALWNIGMDPAECRVESSGPYRHVARAARFGNKTAVVLLDVEKMLRLSRQVPTHL